MLTLLRTRRWAGFTLLVVAAIVGFGLLSRWQWSRADEKRVEAQTLAAESAAAPLPIDEVVAAASVDRLPGADSGLEWRVVTLSGRYEAEAQVLVRKRPLDGRNGMWVLAPLRTDDGAVVWVNRGWVQAEGNATAAQAVPPPPSGDVEVTGRLRPTVPGPVPPPTDLPAGQVTDPDVAALTPDGAATVPYYVELVSSTPADVGPTPLPLPQIDEGRNVSYAVQWILFATVALVGWWYFLRREAREDSAADQPAPVG